MKTTLTNRNDLEMALSIVDDSCVNWLESSNLLFVYLLISSGILSDCQYIELLCHDVIMAIRIHA